MQFENRPIEDVQASDDRYRMLVEQSPDGIAIYDRQGRFSEVNQRACEMLGYSREELLNLSVPQVIAPEDLARQPLRYEILASGQPLIDERLLLCKDGSRLPVELSARMLSNGMFQVIVRDITGRKHDEEEIRRLNASLESRVQERTRQLERSNSDLRAEVAERQRAEDELARSEERYRSLVEATSDVVWTTDAAGEFVEPQESWEAYTGQPWEEHRGTGWIEMIHPEEQAQVLEQWAESVASKTIFKAAGRLWNAASGEYRYYTSRAVPVLTADGNAREWIGTITDIHERRKAAQEREQLLENEQHARRDAEDAVHARDELLAIVSHDLKNPLTAIKGYSQLLRRRLATSGANNLGRLEQVVERIDESSNKMNHLLSDLLDFGRLQAGQELSLQLRSTNLVELAKNAASEFQRSTTNHTIVVEAADSSVIGRWDSTRLEQMAANLLSNAIKYSPNGGTITLRIRTEQNTDSQGEQGEQGVREWAILAIQDEGMGISSAELPHIFEWYRRAKNVAGRISGAGIGLASAKYVVNQHGGDISVASERGVGTTFTVRLPL